MSSQTFKFSWLGVCVMLCSAALAGSTFTVPDDRDLPASASIVLQPPVVQKGGLAAFLDHLKELTARYQPADFDPEALAATLGPGIEPSFNYVRDHIRFESYPGAFRGDAGTFRSRAGNAADRSLLLARLLKSKGVETRFVTGQLATEKAEALFQRLFEPGKGDNLVPSPQQEKNELAARVRARAAHDYAAVRAALGPDLPAGGAIDHGAILRELSSHVWLQAKSGDNWIDLDPCFADAMPGKAYASDGAPSDQLPADDFQQITIRVIVERLDGGALKPETVLEVSRPVADLVDKQIFLVHGTAGDGGVQGLAGGAAQGIAPILFIDGQANNGNPIQFDDAKPSGGSGALGGFGGFGGALGGGGGASGTTQFVAEYLEFELSIPGSEKQVLRRTLIDRGGAVWRSASPLNAAKLQKLEKDQHGPIAAQMIHDICISGGPHDLAGVARLAQSFTVEKQPAAGADAPPAAPAASDAGAQLWLLGLKDLLCQLPTDHWFLPALNDDPSARLYLDSPRISVFSVGVRPDGAKGMMVESQIDWRRDRVRGVARDASAGAAVAKRKIWYGLLEGALEHELAAQTSVLADGTHGAVESTSAALDKAGAVAVRASADGGSAGPAAKNRETAARMAQALKAGDVLVVPRTVLAGNGPPAWWAISAQTADTSAVWGNGINASINRSPLPKPGNSNAGVWELQEDGRMVRVKDPTYNRKGAGNEYGTITIEISLKNIFAVSVIGWGLHEVYRLLVLVFS